MMKILGAPMCINWNYTYVCNFNCQHCYSRIEHPENELTTEQYMKIADNLIEGQVFWINLGGGEPILRKDCIQMIKHLSSNGIKVNLTTNGWLMDENMIANLKNAGLDALFISLDNMNPELHDDFRCRQGSFDRALNSIKLSKRSGMKTYLSTVITKVNLSDVDKIVDFAVEQELTGIDFKRFRPQGNGAKTREKYEIPKEREEELIEKMLGFKKLPGIEIAFLFSENGIKGLDDGCPCGRVSLALLPNGDVSPCVYNHKVIGNLMEDDLTKLWQDSPFLVSLRKDFKCVAEMIEDAD